MATAAPAMVLAGTTSRGEEGLAEFPERPPTTVFADGVADCDTVHEPDGVADRVPDVEDALVDIGVGVGAIRDPDPDADADPLPEEVALPD